MLAKWDIHSGRSRNTACRFMRREAQAAFETFHGRSISRNSIFPFIGFSTLRSSWIIVNRDFRKCRQPWGERKSVFKSQWAIFVFLGWDWKELAIFAFEKTSCSSLTCKLQSWPELLGHKGNKPVKMTYFLPPPPPDAMLVSGIQVIFGKLDIAWGKGGQKKWFTKTTLSALFKGSIQSFILTVHFRS